MTHYYKLPLTGSEIERKLSVEYLPAKSSAENAGKVLVIDVDGNIVPGEVTQSGSSIELDTTLTKTGKAADAKAVGDRFSAQDEEIANKVETAELTNAVRTALTEAKESGEFDGKDGNDYILTETDKTEIAQQAANLIDTALLSIIGTGEVTV